MFSRRSWLILAITGTHNKPLDTCRHVCIIVVKGTRPRCHCGKPLPTCRSADLFALLLSVVLGLNGSFVNHRRPADLQVSFCIQCCGSSEHQWHLFKPVQAHRSAGRSVLLLSVVCGLNGSFVSHFRAADLQGCFHTMLWLLGTSVAAIQALQRWCITKELPRNPPGHESLLFQSLGALLEEQSYMPCQLNTIKSS